MSRSTDSSFAGIVAVAILGCAVVLAIAFQISRGLALDGTQRADRGRERKSDRETQSAELSQPAAPENAAADEASSELPLGDEGDDAGAAGVRAEKQAGDMALTPREERPMPAPRKITPPAAREINPGEGHTVSPHPADEIGEALRSSAQPRAEIATAADTNASKREGLTTPGGAASDGPLTSSSAPAAPAIEMIRGNRRSTEHIAATENDD